LFQYHIAEFLSVSGATAEITGHFHKIAIVVFPFGIKMAAVALPEIPDKQFFGQRFIHVAVIFPQHDTPHQRIADWILPVHIFPAVTRKQFLS
jgi:hypothetical protein